MDIDAYRKNTEEHRAIRFGVLTGVGVAPGSSVLDVGYGHADYHAFLKERGCDVAYAGLDVRQRDLQHNPVAAGSHDWVVCSQTFNLRFGEGPNLPQVQAMMAQMQKIARKGVAIDFATDYVDRREDYLHYYSPEAMFDYAKSLTRRVVLRHDYPLLEFCLYLYPESGA